MSSEESGLSRWARRKAEVRNARGSAAPVVEEQAKTALPAESPATGSAEPAVPPVDLPDIDSLTAESDFTVFLREGVPQQLRRLALRKLWASDPVLANLDGLVDYGEDYTDAAMVVEGMKSAWEVGRGYAKEGTPADGGEAESEPAANEKIAAGEPEDPADGPDLAGERDDDTGAA